MKTKNSIFSIISLFIFALLFWASAVQKISQTENTYKETKKKDENIKVSYKLPILKAADKTTQTQTKGGVTISVEITPFQANLLENKEKHVTYRDESRLGYDLYETTSTPYYEITPEYTAFKIKIKNNEMVPLRLSEVGFAIIIDGTQWTSPTGYLDDWNKGMVLTGFEKEYIVKGPQINGLLSAQVIYILLNGVPTKYDGAGNITKKNNYEWYFDCKTQSIEKEVQKTYSYEYEPVKIEMCTKCNGTGKDPQLYQCGVCKGSGQLWSTGYSKYYTCTHCGGSGKVSLRCENCQGKGQVTNPLSIEAPIENSVTWTGWPVRVTTKPAGAKISIIKMKTGKYESVGISNSLDYYNWLSLDQRSNPFLIEYQGKSVKVLPYDKGKGYTLISVDFTGDKPIVLKGEIKE